MSRRHVIRDKEGRAFTVEVPEGNGLIRISVTMFPDILPLQFDYFAGVGFGFPA